MNSLKSLHPVSHRQRSKLITVHCLLPNTFTFTQIDLWLTTLLNIDEEQLHAQIGYVAQSENETHQCLARIVLCAQKLLQLCRLPLFDLPRLIRIAPSEGGQSECSVVMPLVEHVPTKLYQMGIMAALKSFQQFSQMPLNEENAKTYQEQLKKSFFGPLQQQLQVGKSTMPILSRAYALNIPFIHLSTGIYQLGWGSRSRRLNRSSTDQDSAIGARLSNNKTATARMLLSAGLPAPIHVKIQRQQDVIASCQQLGWPLVIKPNDRDGGVGVTVNITDQQAAEAAFEIAQQQSQSGEVLVEKQVKGVCHRLFVLGDQILYAVKRWPIYVRGNGSKTIQELIEQAQQATTSAPPFPGLDALTLASIQRAGYQIDSVLEPERMVALRPIESTEWGGIDEDVSHTLHPENRRIAILAARLFGLEVAGIDIISDDITQPWYSNQAIINEVNYAPLLGGGEISMRHIDAYLQHLLQDQGRIPIQLFVGETKAQKAAKESWQAYVANGSRAYFTDHANTIAADGSSLPMLFNSAYERAFALCHQPQVDAITIVMRRAEYDQQAAVWENWASVQFFDEAPCD